MATYNINSPQGSESPRGGDDAIRNLASSNRDINNVDHFWPLNGNLVDHADKGKHRYIRFVDGLLSGSFTERALAVCSGTDALAYMNDAVEVELVMSSNALSSGALCLDGAILRNAKKLRFINTSGDTLMDLIAIETYTHSGSLTLDRIFIEAGLRLSGELCMSGNLVTHVADPVSNQDASTKAYADSHILGDATTEVSIFGARIDTDTSSNTLAINNVYQAQADGFIDAVSGINTSVQIYSDSSNPPTTQISQNFGYSGVGASGHCIIRKGEYVKVTRGVDTKAVSIYWTPIGSGGLLKV